MDKTALEQLLSRYNWWMGLSTVAVAVGILGEYGAHFVFEKEARRNRLEMAIYGNQHYLWSICPWWRCWGVYLWLQTVGSCWAVTAHCRHRGCTIKQGRCDCTERS